jgi:hypothetical protein
VGEPDAFQGVGVVQAPQSRVGIEMYDWASYGTRSLFVGHGDQPGLEAMYCFVYSNNGIADTCIVHGDVTVNLETANARKINAWNDSTPMVRQLAILGWFDPL